MQRFNNVQILRLLAAVSVVAGHVMLLAGQRDGAIGDTTVYQRAGSSGL